MVVCVMLLAACSGSGEWKDFASAKGAFAITMPGTPKESSQSVDTAAGAINLTMFTTQVSSAAYLVSYSDCSQKPERRYTAPSRIFYRDLHQETRQGAD